MRLSRILPAAACAALVTLVVPVAAQAAPSLPPTERTFADPVDARAAYDVVSTTARSAPRVGRPAVVVVKHARAVAGGDALDAWLDLDGDRAPDVHVAGAAFSEYVVHETTSFTHDGRDISAKDCVRLSMSGHVSKLRVYPECLGQPVAFAVAVRSSVDGEPVSTADWAPGAERFSKRVLAQPLS